MQVSVQSVLVVLLVGTSCVTKGDVFTAQQTADLIHFVDTLRQCRGIVGLTVAVVKGNESWTRGFGLADRETGRNVSSSDLFGIGSLTKAFTSALISLFINDTSRYSWQTPAAEILGDNFRFNNDQLTREVTLKDMLTHRTGLATTNVPFFAGTKMTRATAARRMKYLPAVKSFRDEFDYNNWMYGLAGHVTEVLGGASWEDLLHAHLLRPLNMSSSGVMGKTVSVTDDNFARPYVMVGEETVRSDPAVYRIHPQEAAGAIAASADDMAQWLLLHVNKGVSTRGERVLNEMRMREMSSDHMSLSKGFRQHSDLWKPQFPVTYASDSYGYGWVTATYRGYPVVWHSGGIYGYTSYLALLPHLDLGVFVSNNGPGGTQNSSHVVRQVFYHVADLLMDEEPWLNASNACQFPQLWLNKSAEDQGSNATVYDDPAFPRPERYAGRYGNPLFGDVSVVRNGSDGLHVRYGLLEGRLFRTGKEEEDNVAMWELSGSFEFLYRHGNKTSYLRLNFTRPSEEGDFREMLLTAPGEEEDLVFHREVLQNPSSGGEGGQGSRDVLVVMVLVCSALCLFAGR